MFGFQQIVDELFRSQRTVNQLIPQSPPITSPSSSSVFFKSMQTANIRALSSCYCKVSATVNRMQSNWIGDTFKTFTALDYAGSIPVWVEPPLPKWCKKPNPEQQYWIQITSGQCAKCKRTGSIRFKQFTAPRHIEYLSNDAYAVLVR